MKHRSPTKPTSLGAHLDGPETGATDVRGRFFLTLLICLTSLAPLLYLLALIIKNYIDTPYYDTWAIYYRIARFMNGNVGLSELLFAQHNESRPGVPRLLLVLLHSITRDLGIVVVLNVVLAVVTATTILFLLKKTNQWMSWASFWAVVIFFNLNFFSIAQWQNWNWHHQVIMFLPNLFFALAWLANVSSLPPLRRTLLVILCCAASSFCFANGLLQWFLVPPLTFGLSRAQKIRVWSLHFSAALVCFVFYFVGYKSPAEHQLGAGLSHKLGRIIAYFLAWLGSSLSEGSLLLAQISGAVLLLSFLCLMLLYLKNWRTAGLRAEWLPWLSMGCYALISGFLAALGRSHIGLEQALRPRYCTISQWFIIGSLGLSVTLLGQNWERKPAGSRLGLALLALISGAFIWFAARHEILAAQEWRTFSESMHFQKQSFGLERERPGQLWTFQIPVDKKAIVSVAYNEMEKAGFLHNFYRSNKILPLITAHKTGSPREGEVTLATYLPTREIICRGWSVGGDAQAGNRVLVVLIFDGSGKVLAVADGPIDQNREDIIRTKRAASDKLAGFTLQFRVPKMNPGVYRLAAFRYGKDEQTYYPIGVPKPLNIPG